MHLPAPGGLAEEPQPGLMSALNLQQNFLLATTQASSVGCLFALKGEQGTGAELGSRWGSSSPACAGVVVQLSAGGTG